MKLNLNEKLVATLLPFAVIIVEGAGKLWDASRDAYVEALAAFPQPKDAAQAVKQVIEDNAKGNPGSVRAYLSTLVWLASAKDAKGEAAGNLKADAIKALTMQAATDLRYPKQPKLAADDFDGKIKRLTERKAKADKAKAEREAEEEKANAADPRRAILSGIAREIAGLDLTTLELVHASIVSTLATIRASDEEAAAAQKLAATG